MKININYVEFATTDLLATKEFFSSVFNWRFSDYGPDYTCFFEQGVNGGFYNASAVTTSLQGAPLVVMQHDNLKELIIQIEAAGGTISRETFSFPGGERFQFIEPGGNELAVWRETESE